jgi:hypothetical protein
VWCVACAVLWWAYVWTHPLVFMATHTNCITMAGLEFARYAAEHEGRYPFHSKRYPNALLLMDEHCFNALTGPGYETAPLVEAKTTGAELPEEDCGRVYIQGLTKRFDTRIAMLFDKLPTPGGDHCPLPYRMWAPLLREVLTSDGTHFGVRESEWPEFSQQQVALLVKEGWDRQEAERLFASRPKWNVKPGLPLAWFAAGAAFLALPIALVAWRRTRKLRAA